MSHHELSPISLAVLLATWLFGPRLAPIIGAYGVIILGWGGGVMIGALRMPKQRGGQRLKLLALIAASFVVTLAMAALLSHALAPYVAHMGLQANDLLMPVSFLIPAVGHSWIGVGKWAAGLLRKTVEAAMRKE